MSRIPSTKPTSLRGTLSKTSSSASNHSSPLQAPAQSNLITESTARTPPPPASPRVNSPRLRLNIASDKAADKPDKSADKPDKSAEKPADKPDKPDKPAERRAQTRGGSERKTSATERKASVAEKKSSGTGTHTSSSAPHGPSAGRTQPSAKSKDRASSEEKEKEREKEKSLSRQSSRKGSQQPATPVPSIVEVGETSCGATVECADADAQTEPYIPDDCVSRTSVCALEQQQAAALHALEATNAQLERRLQEVAVESQLVRDLSDADRADWQSREQQMRAETSALHTDLRASRVQIEQLERHFDGLCVFSQWTWRRVRRRYAVQSNALMASMNRTGPRLFLLFVCSNITALHCTVLCTYCM